MVFFLRIGNAYGQILAGLRTRCIGKFGVQLFSASIVYIVAAACKLVGNQATANAERICVSSLQCYRIGVFSTFYNGGCHHGRIRFAEHLNTIPRIGSIKLTKLTAHDLQKLYKELMESGRTRGKSGHGNPGLSSTTVRSLHLMLHNALNRAVKERLILRNPTEDCIAPKVQKFEMQILQPEHIKTYLDAADRRGLLPMFYLELVSGLRKGELTALLWSDLDITDKTISVSKQYVKNPNGELTLSRPKTETSVRKFSIPQEAVDLLVAEHKKHPDNPYMFPSPVTGEMYYPDSIVNLHKKILKDAGLPHIRFHDLRHTFATLALQNGVDVKTVSSMLGHYDAGFTLRTYTHATRQKQDEAAQTMGSFMAQVM